MEGATERGGFRKDKELEREPLAPIKNEWGGGWALLVFGLLSPPHFISPASHRVYVCCESFVVSVGVAFTLTSTYVRATEQATTDCL